MGVEDAELKAFNEMEGQNHEPTDVVARDELCTFVKRTKKQDYGQSLIETRKSLRKLINKIGEDKLKIVRTDGDFAYESELEMNADIKHVM